MASTKNTSIDEPKKNAAFKAVYDQFLEHYEYIGMGTGSTIKHVIEAVSKSSRLDLNKLKFVPTSLETHDLLLQNNLQIAPFDKFFNYIAIDGADEVDSKLNCIKGGGGALFTEKIVAYYAKKVVIVADISKKSDYLTQNWKKGIPVEVVNKAINLVKNKLQSIGYSANLRKCESGKIGPIITDNGNCILDVDITNKFNKEELLNNSTLKDIETQLKMIPGVVETGLFCEIADVVYLGEKGNQNVVVIESQK